MTQILEIVHRPSLGCVDSTFEVLKKFDYLKTSLGRHFAQEDKEFCGLEMREILSY